MCVIVDRPLQLGQSPGWLGHHRTKSTQLSMSMRAHQVKKERLAKSPLAPEERQILNSWKLPTSRFRLQSFLCCYHLLQSQHSTKETIFAFLDSFCPQSVSTIMKKPVKVLITGAAGDLLSYLEASLS